MFFKCAWISFHHFSAGRWNVTRFDKSVCGLVVSSGEITALKTVLSKLIIYIYILIMTTGNGNVSASLAIFSREYIGHRWVSYARFWCFLGCLPAQAVETTITLPVKYHWLSKNWGLKRITEYAKKVWMYIQKLHSPSYILIHYWIINTFKYNYYLCGLVGGFCPYVNIFINDKS